MKAGIATHVCDHNLIPELTNELLALESNYPEDVANVIQKYSNGANFDKNSDFVLKPHMKLIQKCFQGQSVEEIFLNLENEGSDWSVKQLETLSKCSPTSLKVTFEMLNRGKDLTLQECLVMEHRIVQRCCLGDFPEGVRALLIDKDNSPKWSPSSLGDVTNDIIDSFFAPLPEGEELVF